MFIISFRDNQPGGEPLVLAVKRDTAVFFPFVLSLVVHVPDAEDMF